MTHVCKLKIVLNNVHKGRVPRDWLYPHCDRSKELIKLLWDAQRRQVRKTFSDDEVRLLKRVGFEVEIIGEPYDRG
jgi:hypothetical protein